jgi:hypothetical protein
MNARVAAVTILAVVGVATAGSAHAATDADQVRAVLDRMNTAYNGSDFVEFASHLCADMLQADGFKESWYQARLTNGPIRITVNSVNVSGDPASLAVANVRFDALNREQPKTLDVDFVRERAEWKACRYHAGQTV